ncbi:MotA/TolQ/ExbB proton channel family protein [Chryseobacterium sp. T1]
MAKQGISFLEFLFGSGLTGTIIVILLIFLGLTALYFFVEKFLKLNRENRVDPYLLKNINDLLSETRVQAAIDFCRRDNSPEARSIEKGLYRLGRPISEISNAMETQAQIELNKAEKNINYLATISGIAPILGIFGSVIAFGSIFSGLAGSSNTETQQILAAQFYKALSPAAVGLFIGFFAYIFHNYLVAKVDYMLMKIQYHSNEFLDIINKPS